MTVGFCCGKIYSFEVYGNLDAIVIEDYDDSVDGERGDSLSL